LRSRNAGDAREHATCGACDAMSKAAFWSLWGLVLVLPWDVLTTLPVVGSIPRLAGLVASAVGVLYIVVRRRVRPLSWFHLFAVLFVLWAGATSLWSVDPDATRTVFLTYLQLLVFAWLISEIAWSPDRQRALFQAYVLGSGVAAVLTIHDYVSGAVALETVAGRFAALNQDPNELGLTLALGLPMAWYASLSQTRGAWLWRLYLPLAIAAILLTASRGAVLSALVGLAIIPLTLGRLRPRTKAALYALAAGSLVLASEVVPEASLARIASTRADIEAGYFGGRGAIWVAGLEVAREHPLVGVGAGAFEEAVEPTIHQEMVAHNVFLSVLVEDGLVGLFLFIAMIGATLVPLRDLSPLQRRFSIVLLLSLAVGSMALSWGHRKQFWFVLGALAVQVAPPRRSRNHRFTTSPLVAMPDRPYPFDGM
jgi:O-antigen ligase